MKEKERDLEEIFAAVSRYCNSLTDEEIGRNRAWGEFAEAQFSTDGRVNDCADPAELNSHSEASSEVQRPPIAPRG